MSRLTRLLSLGLGLAASAGPAWADVAPPSSASAGLSIRPTFTAEAWVARNEPLRLELSRPLGPADGRLAVFIGPTDVSSLFRLSGGLLTYDTGTLALPPGETELVVELVSEGGEWKELGRFPLRVLTDRGYQKARVSPAFELALKAQLDEGHQPAANAPPRATFEDLSFQGQLTSEHVRDGWAVKTSFGLLGASHRGEALRFEQLGPEAPRLDLSGYTVEVASRRATLALGDLKHGQQRYLLEGLATRGTRLSLRLGPRLDASLAGLSATRTVGWSNALGVGQDDHRLVSGTFGLEVLPQAGVLRLEASLLDGRARPQAAFGQGVVDDAAEGRGLGLRLSARPLSGRLRLDGGLVWSEFENPADALLGQGAAVVPVAPERRGARHASAALDLLSNHAVTAARPATLTVSYAHDRVDPLFGSVGAPALRADLQQRALGVAGNLGEVTVQYGRTWMRDNLDHLASVLETHTGNDTVVASLPLSALRRGATPSAWLPVLAWNFQRTRQRGAGLPINADFSAGHVPDQVSRSHSGSLTWSGDTWSLAYQHTRSDQDNRQPGRERADLSQRTHGVSLAWSRPPGLTLGVEAALERARNAESGRTDRLQRYALNLDFYLARRLGLNARASHTLGEDDQGASSNRATELDLSASFLLRPLGDPRRTQGRLFVRGASQRARAFDLAFGLDDDRDAWQLSGGLSLSLQ